jgi:hypothetical protein
MALTSLVAYVDPSSQGNSDLESDGILEFCRNETGRHIIRLYLIPTPNDASVAGEEVTISLIKARRDRDEEVTQARVTHTFTGATDPQGDYVEFDLREIKYSDEYFFPVVRRGDYFFEVEHTGGATGPSAVSAETNDFRVTLLTLDYMEEFWLKGATRLSNDDLNVTFQPREITGVSVYNVSRGHPQQAFPLSLSVDQNGNKFLSWNEGRLIKLDLSIPSGIDKEYLLPFPDAGRNGVFVRVNPLLLPSSGTTEYLFVDKERIRRSTIRAAIDQELDWVEQNLIHTPIDPALVVSDFNLDGLNIGPGSATSAAAGTIPENSDYDIKRAPITFFPVTPGHWIDIRLPMWRPLKFEYLVGALENTRIVDINIDWIHKGASGYITLIPFNQSLSYHFMGLLYLQAARGPTSIPSFWRYRYWAGIGDEQTPTDIIEVAGLRAASKLLSILGQMFKGGIAGTSQSAGGKSQSIQFTASATFGIYSATIEEFKKKLEKLEGDVQKKYYGITFDIL